MGGLPDTEKIVKQDSLLRQKTKIGNVKNPFSLVFQHIYPIQAFCYSKMLAHQKGFLPSSFYEQAYYNSYD